MSPWLVLEFLLCPVVFLTLLRKTAPYGRHFSAGWGPTLPNRLAWFLMELPALLIIAMLLAASPLGMAPVALVPCLLWSVHYGYRTLLFPVLMRPSGKSFPALLVIFAIAFNGLNGYNNAQALIANAESGEALWSVHFFAGAGIFLAGLWLHITADHSIRNLRWNDFSGYGVPRGGWFTWISNPNYLGEILQWTGWAILTWSWAGLAFALFTFCNLAPRAMANHRWYQETFADYPAGRKILIPGLF
ncbi:MAG TPA: methyltransferase [Xanthomonadales bacterium]|nr:methyltransferase [Xanthomonadales bacterium]